MNVIIRVSYKKSIIKSKKHSQLLYFLASDVCYFLSLTVYDLRKFLT